MSNKFNTGYQYDRCISRGICSINPTTASLQEVILIYLRHLAYFGIKLEENTIKNLRKSKTSLKTASEEVAEIEKSLILFKKLLTKNGRFEETAIDEVIQKYWFETCRKSTHNGLKILRISFKSALYYKKLSLKDNCRLFVRALIKY